MLTANELTETRTMDLQRKEFLTNYNVSVDCNHISLDGLDISFQRFDGRAKGHRLLGRQPATKQMIHRFHTDIVG